MVFQVSSAHSLQSLATMNTQVYGGLWTTYARACVRVRGDGNLDRGCSRVIGAGHVHSCGWPHATKYRRQKASNDCV